MKRLLLSTALMLTVSAMGTLVQAQQTIGPIRLPGFPTKAVSAKDSAAYKALTRKWIVRSVRRDGKPNAAQIGQKVGDVITVKQSGVQLVLG